MAVVVVHGVGEVIPGEIAEALIEKLDERPDVTADPRLEILELDDRVPGASGAEQRRYDQVRFPAHVRSATLDTGARVTFAELYWADLTRVGSGRVNTLLGLVRVLFEAHYLIDAMLNRRGGVLTRTLRFLLLALSQFLRGPIAAMSLCVTVICWVGINSHHIGKAEPLGWLQRAFSAASVEMAFAVAMVATVILAAGLAAWLWRAGDLTWIPMLGWTGVFGLFIAAALILVVMQGAPLAERPSAGRIMDLSYRCLIYMWWGWGAMFIVALWVALLLSLISAPRTLLGLVARNGASNRRAGAAALTAAGTLALQFVMWGALSGTLVLPILARSEEIVALTVLKDAHADTAAAQFLTQRAQSAALEPGQADKQSKQVKALLDVPHFSSREFDWIERYKYVYGYIAVIVIAFLLVFLALVGLRRIIVVLCGDHLGVARRLMPRLLFNVNATVILLGFVLIQVVINILLGENFADIIRRLEQGNTRLDDTPLDWLYLQTLRVAQFIGIPDETVRQLVVGNRYTIIALAAVLSVGLPLLLGNSLNNALHIARDLIDHHYGPREGRAYTAAADRKLAEDERLPRRARIRHRLHTLLAALRQRGRIDGVVFVAHSQGSVIVYDYLACDAQRGFPEIGGLKPAVVTCGSPLMHLYERYFHEYARFNAELATLAPHHAGWTNLYRIDDYIGTRIGRDERYVTNIILPAGGHAGYWGEEAVAAAVHASIGRALAAAT